MVIPAIIFFFVSSHTSFIDNRSQPQDSPASHVAVDRLRDALPASSDAEPTIIMPYFPRGLAAPPENITDFNFTLFLYDSLKLPYGLFTGYLSHEVVFANIEECRDYCTRFVATKESWCRRQGQTDDHSEEMRRQLSKDVMFHQTGTALGVNLKYGNERFDRNLENVRVDIFGNVMILDAPHWSDISVQFTHGFPRRLIPYHHRGFLSGNITVAARISNQAIRSLSTGKKEKTH